VVKTHHMKNIYFFILIFFSVNNANAQCAENTEEKILLVGDSWAFFLRNDTTFDKVLDHWGHSNYTFNSNATLVVNGAETKDFLEAERLAEIKKQLDENPSIKVVHLSIAGNDFLGEWNVDFTETETEELYEETFDNTISIIDFIKETRPGISILYSGYMYANFAEVIADATPFEMSHPFYGTWEDMGFPTFEQLNELLEDFSNRLLIEASGDDQIEFINVPGLMQYIYGQEEPLGVPPGGSYPPFFQPLPSGDVTYPSPKISMRDYGLFRDCFHLSEDGYFNMLDYQTQKFYHKFLMDEAHFIAESASAIGSVSSSGEISDLLRVGDDGGNEFATVLEFSTIGEIEDTVVSKASLFLRRESLTGANPVGENITVRMKIGNFGASEELEMTDFSEDGDIEATACVFGKNEVDSDWIRIDLPETFLPLINGSENIQFVILANEEVGGTLNFSGIDDPDFAPVLNIDYQSDFVSINENELNENSTDLFLFPNPVKNDLTIVSKKDVVISQLEIVNVQGQIILKIKNPSSKIDLSGIISGNYFIKATTNDEVIVKQFIKR